MPDTIDLLVWYALLIMPADVSQFQLEMMKDEVKDLLGRIITESTREVYQHAMERVRNGADIRDLVPTGRGLVSLQHFLSLVVLNDLLRAFRSHACVYQGLYQCSLQLRPRCLM